MSPELVEQLRNDVRKDMLGDSLANSLDYMRRNMAAVIFQGIFLRHVDRRVSRSFFTWKYSKLCVNCLHKDRAMLKMHREKQEEEKARRSRIVGRVAARLQRANLVRAWQTWSTGARVHAERAHRSRVALERLRRRREVAALHSWKLLVSRRRRVRELVVRTAGRGKRQGFHLALSAWTEMVYAAQQADLDEEERQRRARLEEAMSVHAERDDLHDMCDNLRAELEDERARMRAQMEDAEVAALHALQERQTAQMKHVLRRLRNQQTAQAVRKWRAFVSKMRKADRVWAHFSRRALSKSWRAWRAKVRELKRQRGLLGKGTARLRHRRANAAMTAWKARVRESRRVRTIIARSTAKLRLKAAAAAMASWKDLVRQQARTRRLLAKGRARLCNRAMANAFVTWVAHRRRRSGTG